MTQISVTGGDDIRAALDHCKEDFAGLYKAHARYSAALKDVGSIVHTEFQKYLGSHPEIPKEKHWLWLSPQPKSWHGVIGLYRSLEDWMKAYGPPRVRVVLGTADHIDAHDFTVSHHPRDVSGKFTDFIRRGEPLQVKVLKYFEGDTYAGRQIDGPKIKIPFYGESSQYKQELRFRNSS